MRVWLDPNRLAALKLTATDVAGAIRAQNVQATAGELGAEGEWLQGHESCGGGRFVALHTAEIVRSDFAGGTASCTERAARRDAARPVIVVASSVDSSSLSGHA